MGHPCKFQRVALLGSVTAQYSSTGRQPNFAALNRPVQNQQTTETYVLRKDLDELVTADLKTEKME